MLRTRQQILTAFDLRTPTLDHLIGTDQLEHPFEPRDGRMLMDVTKDDVFVLTCARASIFNFGTGSVNKGKVRGIHAFPFHRLLLLHLVTEKLEDVYEGIFQMGLLPSKTRFPLSDLRAIYDRFLSFCPPRLRRYVGSKKSPTKEADKNFFRLFLEAIDILFFYDHPESVEQLLLFLRFREPFEALLTTNGTCGEVAEATGRLFLLKEKIDSVSAYRQLFYAFHDLTKEDQEAYLLMLTPSEQKRKSVV